MKKMKTKNKKNALQILKEERIKLKASYLNREKLIEDEFNNLKDNWPNFLLQSVLSKVKEGVGVTSKSNGLFQTDSVEKPGPLKKMKSFGKVTMTAAPIVWSIAQPFLIKYAIKKVTNKIFKQKK